VFVHLLLTSFFASIPPDVLNRLLQITAKGAERQNSAPRSNPA
jgi:hypothetical protein